MRRLRALLEGTEDARELTEEIIDEGLESGGDFSFNRDAMESILTAYRARLLDEAAERAIAQWRKGHPYNFKTHEAELRAAVRGEVE